MSNVDTVQAIYGAFGRGDIPFILDQVADTVDWDYASASDVPWLQPRQGKAGVRAFFVALIDIEATTKTIGNRVQENDETHIWRFDAQGRSSVLPTKWIRTPTGRRTTVSSVAAR